MTRDLAVKIAREKDLKAKAGFWYKAVSRKEGWVVVRINGETGEQRKVRV